MKNKLKKYVILTKYNENITEIDEERLYKIEGVIVSEYVGGNFQKSRNVKESLRLFASSEAHFAAVYFSKKELTVKIKAPGCYIFTEKIDQDDVKRFNLKNSKIREKFLLSVF